MKKQFVDGYGNASGRKDKLATLGLIGVCVAALVVTIVIAGIVVNVDNTDTDAAQQQTEYEAEVESTVVVEATDTEEEMQEEIQEETAPASAEPITFEAPCRGSLLKEFSVDMPIYSETLDDWRIHNGIDIAAPLGADVCAVADGIVSDMYDDMRNGLTVVIDHEGGIRSIYSNLSELDYVQISDVVKKGDIISTVGDTTLFETIADTHLHFEILADGKHENPLNYFELRE